MRRRYDDYKRLCDELGIKPQCGRWRKHSHELQRRHAQLRNEFLRLTGQQLQQWWLDRFTLDEIREMAGAIEWLTIEEAA